MEFWLHAIAGCHYADESKCSFYWLRLDYEGIVKVDDNALSSSYLQLGYDAAEPNLDRSIYVVGYAEERFLTSLALYSPSNEDGNKWEIKETPFDLCLISCGSVPINHKTLYWVDVDHQLVAYNIDHGMLSVPLNLGFISEYTPIMSSINARNPEFEHVNDNKLLYHIAGDRFCFIWYRSGPDDNKIHCTFLNISNVFADDLFVLVASELARHTYSIPRLGFGIRSITPVMPANIGN